MDVPLKRNIYLNIYLFHMMRNINISHFPNNTNQPVFLNKKQFCFMKVKSESLCIIYTKFQRVN
jgi:hypothetical protein